MIELVLGLLGAWILILIGVHALGALGLGVWVSLKGLVTLISKVHIDCTAKTDKLIWKGFWLLLGGSFIVVFLINWTIRLLAYIQ